MSSGTYETDYEILAGADYILEESFTKVGEMFESEEDLERAIEKVLVDVAEWLSEELGAYGKIGCFKKIREYICEIPFNEAGLGVIVVVKFGVHINSMEFEVESDNDAIAEEVEEVLSRFTEDRYWFMAVESDFYVLGGEILGDALYAYLYDELGAIENYDFELAVSDDGFKYLGRARFEYGGEVVWVSIKGELVIVVHNVFADLVDLGEDDISEETSGDVIGKHGVDREFFYVEAIPEDDFSESGRGMRERVMDVCEEIRRLRAMGQLDKLSWIGGEVIGECLDNETGHA